MRLVATPIATWFGCGYSPVGPGTVGSIAALAIAWLLVTYAGWQAWYFLALAAALTPAAIWSSDWVEHRSGVLDPHWIVVDEVVGQWITLAGATSLNWKGWLAAFVLFRVLDIWKPPPIRQSQALPGGWGVVGDDVLAGLAGGLVLYTAGCFNLY